MKQFFKIMFASMLGTIIIFFIGFFMMIGALVGSIASIGKSEAVTVKNNSVLTISLEADIVDRSNPGSISDFQNLYKGTKTIGLNEILSTLKKAKEDDRIRGILLDLGYTNGGWSNLSEIRKALEDFKESGKFIYAYSESLDQKSYYVGSVADKIYMNREGMLELKGISSKVMFYKGLLEKIGVEMQIIRHGKFKSAVEPYFLDKMSKENKDQVRTYIGSIWNSVATEISQSRKMDINEFNRITNDLAALFPEDAAALNIIDDVKTRLEMDQLIKNDLQIDEEEDYESISYYKYKAVPNEKAKKEYLIKDKIAIIYAQGEINMGDGNGEYVGSIDIPKAIMQAAKDEQVKAIVFRINSPGGSALSSEVIYDAVMKAREKKPVVASFGDYAASGGYYIAAGCDKIFANPTTLTGSIGVFGVIPNAQKLLNNTLGVSFDTVISNTNADLLASNRPMTTAEEKAMNKMVVKTYGTFISHVAEGRGMTTAQVDEIGQGRVWSGIDGKRIGLVDEFGGLEEAVAAAAEIAGISEYQRVELPQQKDFFTQMVESLNDMGSARIKKEMGAFYEIYENVQAMSQEAGVQARLPFMMLID